MSDIQFHALSDGRKIAFRETAGRGPTLVFLPGYLSDMEGGKATALFGWARENGQSCLLLDYSGCGQSSGEFADGSLGIWCDEVLALVRAHIDGQVVLVGSSMGGWLMLLCALEAGDRIAGLIGIAAAPDFTGWGYSDDEKAQLEAGETIYQENDYGYDPAPTHPLFWRDGQENRLLDQEIAIDCPVRLIHGQADNDVPHELSLRIAAQLRSADVQVTLIKDGDHRLSRDADIDLLLRSTRALLESLPAT